MTDQEMSPYSGFQDKRGPPAANASDLSNAFEVSRFTAIAKRQRSGMKKGDLADHFAKRFFLSVIFRCLSVHFLSVIFLWLLFGYPALSARLLSADKQREVD